MGCPHERFYLDLLAQCHFGFYLVSLLGYIATKMVRCSTCPHEYGRVPLGPNREWFVSYHPYKSIQKANMYQCRLVFQTSIFIVC